MEINELKLEKVKKSEGKSIGARIPQKDYDFLKRNKIDVAKFIRIAVRELREKSENETTNTAKIL